MDIHLLDRVPCEPHNNNEDKETDDDDIFIMVECMCVCMYVTQSSTHQHQPGEHCKFTAEEICLKVNPL